MAESLEPPAAAAAPPPDAQTRREAAQLRLWEAVSRASRDLIYTSMQRSGGEPFGPPFELGLSSLTERVVRFFHQRGYFGFNSVERLGRRAARNRYTRHGATPYRGAYQQLPPPPQGRGAVQRLLRYLREQRYFLGSSLRAGPPPPAGPPPRRR